MFARSLAIALTALLSFSGYVDAQTYTDCFPLNVTCPPNKALGTNATFDFTASTADDRIWNQTSGPMKYGTSNGAEFTIAQQGQSPTIKTQFHIFFGEVTVNMKVASGTGIISSVVLLSDDLDEIDWEFMGGNRTHVATNYFGKNNQTDYTHGKYHLMPDGSAPQDDFHNYTLKWTSDKLEWYIDNHLLRTLLYNDDPHWFPQTPMTLRLGVWAGGDPTLSKGVREWAGGDTDFKKAPFSMLVRNAYMKDYTDGAKEYVWSDKSGSWQSIKATMGQSEAAKDLTAPSGVSGRWRALPQTTRTAIIACSIGGLALLVVAGLAFCYIQGRKGKREKAIADQAWEKEQNEFNQYRMQMMKGGFNSHSQPVH